MDQPAGPEDLGQLLDGLGLTAAQLGVDQPQLLNLLQAQQVQQQQGGALEQQAGQQLDGAGSIPAPFVGTLQQAQQALQEMAGTGGMQAAGWPLTGVGLLPGLGGSLHMPQPPFGMPAGPALHPAAQLAAQQAALLASASQYAMAASASGMLPPGSMRLPLGSMPFTAGFPQHLLAPWAAGGLPAPALQAAAAAGVPLAAAPAAPSFAVPAVEPAAAAQPAGMAGRAGTSSGGGSASTSHSSSEIANLQEAQSATEDAQQLLSEDVDRLSIKVEGHDEQLRWVAQHGFAWAQVAGVCVPPATKQVLPLHLLPCVQWAAHTFQ